MQRARALDSQAPTGLLHGLPIAVKDLFDTFDLPTCYGSPIYADHRPAADAACVALARAAGAVVVGKTVTTEFATFHPGPTCNPRNPKHTPGGSSSGSAAAVADEMVPLAFGTQTAGSIVRPAAFCGVVGYKPTYGTINRVGVKMISDTLDTVGVLARTVPDAALFVAALSDRRELLIERPPAGAPRVGLCRTYEWDRARPETVAMFEDAARRLKDAGARVRDVTLPPQFAGLVDAQLAIMVREVAQSLAHEWHAHREGLSDEMIAMIEAGLAVSPERYDAARTLGAKLPRGAREVFSTASTSCSRRAPSARRRKEYRRPATRCSTGYGRCCARRASICRWGWGRADCRSASRSRGRSERIDPRCWPRTGSTRGSAKLLPNSTRGAIDEHNVRNAFSLGRRAGRPSCRRRPPVAIA